MFTEVKRQWALLVLEYTIRGFIVHFKYITNSTFKRHFLFHLQVAVKLLTAVVPVPQLAGLTGALLVVVVKFQMEMRALASVGIHFPFV